MKTIKFIFTFIVLFLPVKILFAQEPVPPQDSAFYYFLLDFYNSNEGDNEISFDEFYNNILPDSAVLMNNQSEQQFRYLCDRYRRDNKCRGCNFEDEQWLTSRHWTAEYGIFNMRGDSIDITSSHQCEETSIVPDTPNGFSHFTQVSPGIDPRVPTLQTTPCLPSGNDFSLRLGTPGSTSSWTEILTKTIRVQNNDGDFSFNFAGVYQDPGHNENQRPAFRVEIRDALTNENLTGNRVDLGNGSNELISNNPLLETFGTLKFIDWSCAVIDLSGLENRTIHIHFINRDCDQGGHWGYTYLDNLGNALCGEIAQQPALSISDMNYNPCTCQGQICLDYQLAQGVTEMDMLLSGWLNIELEVTQNYANLQTGDSETVRETLSSDLLTSGSTYCFDLNEFSIIDPGLGGFDFNVAGIFGLGCFNLTPIVLGNDLTGQNNDFNDDILNPICEIPVIKNLGESNVCSVLKNNSAPNIIRLDLDNFENFSPYIKLWKRVNDGPPVELDPAIYNAAGTFNQSANYELLDCPITCDDKHLKFTNYKYYLTYSRPGCLATRTIVDTSNVVSVNVYPPLQKTPFYTETSHPDCYRDNVPVELIRPCYGGSNGAINVDVKCIVGGMQNLDVCRNDICTETDFVYTTISDIVSQTTAHQIVVVPEVTSLTQGHTLAGNGTSWVKVHLSQYQSQPGNFNIGVFEEESIYNLNANGTVTIPGFFLNERTRVIKVEITYHLNYTNPEVGDVEFIIPAYALTVWNAVDSQSTTQYCAFRENPSGVFSFNLYRDQVFNYSWEEDCRKFIGSYNNISCGIAAFGDASKMHQGDYLLEVTSETGCGSTIEILIPLEQLDLMDAHFTQSPYYWCTPEPLEIEILPDLNAGYNFSWDRFGEDGVAALPGNPAKLVLEPTACTGGEHTVYITRTGSGGDQNCTLEKKVRVIDFNPPPLKFQHYEDVLAIGAVKYRSTWLNDFNDLQVDDFKTLIDLRDRNPYATGQAGVFRLHQSYDYLDERRQFENRQGNVPVNPVLTNETETILQTDGVIGRPDASDKTIVKGFSWNHPKLESCAPEWKFNNEITKYNLYNFDTENKDILGRYSASLYGYNGQLVTAVAANADYREIAFESFEESSQSTGDTLIHQFNNTTGNFDFVSFDKPGIRQYFDEIEVLSGFGNYAIIDLPYESACENRDKFVIKYVAESLEFKCSEQNIVNEITGGEVEVSIHPDPCGSDRAMIIFDDIDMPGFPVNNDEQYWNGFVYVVSSSISINMANNLERGIQFVSNKSHTGVVSMKILANNNNPVRFTHQEIELQPGKEYLLSAWIHAAAFNDYSPLALREYNFENKIGLYVSVGIMNEQFFAPKGDVIEGWQRVEAHIKTPQTSGKFKVSFNPVQHMYIDDIRLHPVNGGMQSYVYDLQRYRLVAILDNNNYATFYRYDDEGALFHLSKETMDGIKTLQVSSSYLKPNE